MNGNRTSGKKRRINTTADGAIACAFGVAWIKHFGLNAVGCLECDEETVCDGSSVAGSSPHPSPPCEKPLSAVTKPFHQPMLFNLQGE
jgi:hypothetical protein